MRIIRLFLYFLLGVFLSAVSVLSYAETIPATPKPAGSPIAPTGWKYGNATRPTAVEAAKAGKNCGEAAAYTLGGAYGSGGAVLVNQTADTALCSPQSMVVAPVCPAGASNAGAAAGCITNTASYECPANGNWTLDGQMCTRPDCVSPQTRQADGTCGMTDCQLGANARIGGGSYKVSYPITPGSYCVEHCTAYAAGDRNRVGDTVIVDMYVNGAGGSASNCTVGQTDPSPQTEPTDLEPPPCPPGAGSYLSAGGVVMCTSPTTPNSTVPPVVTKGTEKVTYPDGSDKTTETTKTCTADGACTTTTKTTTTGAGGAGGGGTPGQAGTPGTTTGTGTTTGSGSGSGSGSGQESSDFCAKNPNLQICKGGMNEEATQKAVLEEIKKFTDPEFPTDETDITGATHSTESQTALDAENQKNTDAGTGVSNPVGGQQGAWASAMETGWFSDIPMTGCTPFVLSPLGKSFVLDHCAVAAQVSDIGAYALWIVLSVGVFVMLTGGRREE